MRVAGAVAIVAAFAVLGAGCVEPQLVPCEDGRACPVGTVCDEVHVTCIDPERETACKDVPPEGACVTGEIANGRCFDGVCFPAGCGNGFLEAGEMCEPGLSPTGRCSFDCSSTEVCGNGVVDVLRGELCDDADLVSHDGCSSTCLPESTTWANLIADADGVIVSAFPPGRFHGAMAYDAARGELVLFGGSQTTVYGDTWVWSHGAWQPRIVSPSPTPRSDHAMAYDPVRKRVVLFGGLTDGGTLGIALLNDTWEWDGARWEQRSSFSNPGQRQQHAMAWDPISKQVVVFGGRSVFNNDEIGDTWGWNGATWTRLAQVGPAARAQHAMATDPVRGRIVMFGGRFANADVDDTWEWNGSAWSERVVTPRPPARSDHAMVFDPVAGGVVVYGGTDTQTWSFDGAWLQIGFGAAPQPANGVAFAFDHANEVAVAVGGGANENEQTSALWSTARGWKRYAPQAMPANGARLGTLVYDRARATGVLVGGASASAHGDAQMWRWDGFGWNVTRPVLTPEPIALPAAAYDARRQRVVMFGGAIDAAATPLDATWEWDGAVWAKLALASKPPARTRGQLAFDEDRGQMVLFGGTGVTGALDDTWERAGGDWTRVGMGQPGPSGRTELGLAYDRQRKRTVLFGGRNGTSTYGDTWEWDGTAWRELSPALQQAPRARFGHSMVYDPRRQRVVLLGGRQGAFVFNDVWEWDGTAWNEVASSTPPPTVNHSAAMYDEARAQIVVFGADVVLGTAPSLMAMRRGGVVEESCAAGLDLDGDGTSGCDDIDCGPACAPMCPLATSCADAPRCGDGTCSAIESARMCPADCGAPLAICGDGFCDPGELASCADCP